MGPRDEFSLLRLLNKLGSNVESEGDAQSGKKMFFTGGNPCNSKASGWVSKGGGSVNNL